MKTAIILLAIALLIAAPIPACAQAAQPTHGIVIAANGGPGMGCPGCPGCPDNPNRTPGEPGCY